MDPVLLTTKVQIPPQPPGLVRRARLVEAVQHGIPRYKLILVTAPAGYGKTTLLAQWAHDSRHPVAWLSLSEGDNDVERFFRYLLAAWEAVQPGVMESPLGILLGAMAPDSEAVLAAFINEADEVPEHTVFVLDDYHLIREAAIHEALSFLLEHLPPSVHFVLSCRGEPPLPLARYRARHELLELGAEELSFLPEETADFLNERMGLDLAPEEIDPLQTETEGWVTGLQLAALSLRRHPARGEGEHEGGYRARPTVDGRQRFVADYLSEDVLAQLQDQLRNFLLQTSILERLSGPLCEAVTEAQGGQERLEVLEREDLFLVPLDDRREWFRYHHLFADFLRRELKRRHPEEVAGLHRRAARWYLEQAMPEAAFSHAVEADDVELVMRIFDRSIQAKLTGGEFKVVKRWLDAIPDAWYGEYPLFGLVRTGLLLFTGQLDASIRSVEEIEQRLVSPERDGGRPEVARVRAVRCSIACFQNDLERAERFADEAFQNLRAEDHLFRAIVLGSLGDTYRRNGRWKEAKECYLELLEFVDAPEFRVQSAHVYGALADLDLRQGRLQDADSYWKRALEVIQERGNWGRLPLPLIGWVYIRRGELLYEWNELAQAWEHVTQGLERAEVGGDVRAQIAGTLIAGRLKLTEGDVEAATEYLERARPLVEKAHFAHWISRFERFQLELWLAQDRLRAAVNWADAILQDDALEGRAQVEVARLAMARVLIVKGDEPSLERALALLETLLQVAQEEGRMGVSIEALALQALAHDRRREVAGAMTSLERALRLAEPEGYVRRFADLGLPMARLLQEARSRDVMPDYVETLLGAFEDGLAVPTPEQEVLPEPLTDREEDVLGLMAAGLTNREIAEQLVISPQTVKKHAGNIYGKLGVGNRTEAAAKARELDLLD